jgi:hypothetical protein
MALVTISEIDPTLERLVIVDPTNVVEQNISNNSSQTLQLTFVKDFVRGKVNVLVADDTVPIPECKPGEDVVVTEQMINDAIAAGNHSDIYVLSKRENITTSVPRLNITVAGQTQPDKKSGKKSK